MKHLLVIAFLCGFTTAQAGSYAYQQGESMQFGWLSSDMFTFFSASNTVMKVSTKSVDNIDSHNSAIWMKGWAFASYATFYSFYPYDIHHRIDNTPYSSIPVSFTNQIQTSNRSTEHLASYDYMTAQGTSTSDALSLNFTHLGCIMRIAAYIPEGKTYTSLSLTTKDNTSWFATEATVNATNNTMTTTATASTATLSLSDVAVATDDYLTAYIMMAPADLTGKTLALTLTASDGSVLQAYITGCNMQQGRVYSITLGTDNYFRLQPASYQGDAISPNYQQSLTEGFDEPTDNQITEVAAYAPDFMADAENKMVAVLLGDVNVDGVVDVTDAVIVINHYQARTTEELDFNIADVNGDGEIDVTDAVGIINIYQNKQ